jgi:hypothetical protein
MGSFQGRLRFALAVNGWDIPLVHSERETQAGL